MRISPLEKRDLWLLAIFLSLIYLTVIIIMIGANFKDHCAGMSKLWADENGMVYKSDAFGKTSWNVTSGCCIRTMEGNVIKRGCD